MKYQIKSEHTLWKTSSCATSSCMIKRAFHFHFMVTLPIMYWCLYRYYFQKLPFKFKTYLLFKILINNAVFVGIAIPSVNTAWIFLALIIFVIWAVIPSILSLWKEKYRNVSLIADRLTDKNNFMFWLSRIENNAP